MTKKIIEQVQAIANEGKTIKQIRGFLAFEHNLEGKEATALIAQAGIGGSVSTGFAADFYALLKDAPLSDADFDALIAAGSNNVQKHKSHYNAIRELANSIHAQK